MYIIILGAGTIGTSIAEILIKNQHEVAVIDSNEEKCKLIDNKLGSISVLGNISLPNSLLNAGISRADLFISTTKNDAKNMLSCQLAKDYFKVQYTVSITHSKEISRLLDTINVNYTININEHITNELIAKIKMLGFNINVSN
ncbi:MAG: hypothetical protein CL758_08740 [Chloroflexi bacterium]|nr:hypothetical protein [Chloroflexota bacterium]|tara:strand:+ start:11205 stop:11633 length:429 start_codon:yes stop_codon:yes gene_type:complete